MSYEITWTKPALDEIADTRDAASADELVAIEKAIKAAVGVLEQEAPTAGESRDAGNRILIERPLAFAYRLDGEEAVILFVWWCTP